MRTSCIFVQAGQGLGDELLDLASIVQQGGSADGIDPLTLRNRLDALTAQQAELLDKVLEDMENEELNAQLKATMEEKQAILGRLGALQQDEEQRAGQEARLRELAEWLKQQNLNCEKSPAGREQVPALPDSFPLKPQFTAGWQYVPEFLALQRLPRCIFFIYRRKIVHSLSST